MKRLFSVMLLVIVPLTVFAAPDDLEVFTYLYTNARTASDRLGILRIVIERKIPNAGPFYATALKNLLKEYPQLRGNQNNLTTAVETARLVAGALGDEKYAAAADDLWAMVEAFEDPGVKSDTMIAIGRLRETKFIENIMKILTDLNERPVANAEAGERIAFGAIVALEKFADPRGYIPVYFATTAWYKDWIKKQASLSLPFISQDPTEPMISIIRGTGYSPGRKLSALQTLHSPDISSASKASAAAIALAQGWQMQITGTGANASAMRRDLSGLRKLAITMLKESPVDNQAVYPLLERSYKEGADMDEKLESIQALSALATENAAGLLSSFVNILNGKLGDNTLTRDDETLIRALIPALGRTKQSSGRTALELVQRLNWSPTVKNLATDALKNL